MKFLVLGDLHIPTRAEKIPEKFEEIFNSEGFNKILCTGDLVVMEVYEKLCSFGEVICVQGNMDYVSFNNQEILEVEGIRVGLIHGKGIYPRGDINQLYEIAKKLNVDLLIHGHTHKFSIEKFNKKIFINPGSATGVIGGYESKGIPSIVLFEINKKIFIKHLYLKGNILFTEKFEINEIYT